MWFVYSQEPSLLLIHSWLFFSHYLTIYFIKIHSFIWIGLKVLNKFAIYPNLECRKKGVRMWKREVFTLYFPLIFWKFITCRPLKCIEDNNLSPKNTNVVCFYRIIWFRFRRSDQMRLLQVSKENFSLKIPFDRVWFLSFYLNYGVVLFFFDEKK